MAKGEVQLTQSSGQQSSLEACQQACIANSECVSISYNAPSKQCNQYSTQCSITTFEPETMSYRLERPATTAAPTTTAPATTAAPITTLEATTTAGTMHCAALPLIRSSHLYEHALFPSHARAPSRVLTLAVKHCHRIFVEENRYQWHL